ncbi:MAG: hypothetical protein EZS28_024794 [Streblomastix strix]|uniref:Uncharacterized protein n=1 Tax=Streblomastix strix TaxID=222440 RepID=A0A5J4VAT9_9EUKA|nr:MAG: hypothetical protein EZS28_024794 [Streblomastix strix]
MIAKSKANGPCSSAAKGLISSVLIVTGSELCFFAVLNFDGESLQQTCLFQSVNLNSEQNIALNDGTRPCSQNSSNCQAFCRI